MRTYKYRAWSSERNEMLDHKKIITNKEILDQFLSLKEGHSNSTFVFMQSVELSDSKTKAIYEGDIIQGIYKIGCMEGSTVGVVQFNKENSRYELNSKDSKMPLGTITEKDVIGNIFENKELIAKYEINID